MYPLLTKKTAYLALLFILVNFTPGLSELKAQEKNVCDSLLTNIENNYNTGNFDDALNAVFNCLDRPEITKNQKMKAYRFLGLIYIAQNYIDDAKKAIAKLLDLIPNYEPDPVQDPPPYRNLVREQKAVLILDKQEKEEETSPFRQMYISANAGASFPMGDFGDNDINNGNSGFANIGYCFDGNFFYSLEDYIIWSSSVVVSINALNESSFEQAFPGLTITTGNYITTWITSGVGCLIPVANKINVYGTGQIGLLMSSYPDITLANESTSATQTTAMGTAFAYSFATGAIISHINVSVKYMSGKPEYKKTTNGRTLKSTYRSSILTLTVGYVF